MKKTTQDPKELIRDHKYWRLAELVPGLLTWGAFSFVILGSIFIPNIVANLVLLYTLVWIYRSFYFSFHLSNSYQISTRAQKTDWIRLLNFIEYPQKLHKSNNRQEFQADRIILNNKKQPLEQTLEQRIEELKGTEQYLKPSDILHCVNLVSYKEPYEVIRASVKSIVDSNFDLKKVILMLSLEERDYRNATSINQRIEAEFGHLFKKYMFTLHPKKLPGEHVGRAANATWAGKVLKTYLEENKITYENLILSTFDADTAVSQEFLNELTFRYLVTPNRVEVGYQPVPFYHNNIWDVPIFNRLVAISCTFWQWSVSLRKDENKSFSSRSMSFKSVLDFNYWDTTVVQDDSRQYWTAFFVYNGRHYCENIYSPVYMDAVQSNSYFQTVRDQYKQLVRWAWGASDFPFILFNMIRNKHISWTRKIYELVHFLESIFFWATGPILLIFAGSIPSLLNSEFRDTVLSYNLPKVMSISLNIATVGILVCLLITLKIIPRNENTTFWQKISLYLQWILVPIVSVILSSLPAIEAQTRLLFNKRLDFHVTKKTRKVTT